MRKALKYVSVGVLSLAILGGGALGASYFVPNTFNDDGGSQVLVIGKDATGTEIADMLYEHGLIRSTQVFKLWLALSGTGSKLQSGHYQIPNKVSVHELINLLQEGHVESIKLTIPEGYTLEQIAETVTVNAAATANKNTKTPFSKEDFLNKAQDEDFIAKMAAKYPQLLATLPSKDSGVKYRLEGYLFPATYDYGKETTVEELIDQMLAAMNTNLSQYYSTIESKNLTVNDVLTLASLVEKEGSTDQDRKDIASVFYNRLNQAMPLQSNIALLYAQGKLGQKTTLKEDAEIDTNLDSPYNVYKKQGLMPGPVDSPSLSAIEATINPSKTEYLYFVANVETGAVYFANTYEEHAKNVEEHVNSKLNQSGESSN